MVIFIQCYNSIFMSTKIKLSPNGCLYMTLGFKQKFTLQLLTFNREQKDQIHLILYDGLMYIGAVYPLSNQSKKNNKQEINKSEQDSNQNCPEKVGLLLKPFDIVKVIPELVLQNEPILIKDLQIIETEISGILGKEIITIKECLNRKKFIRDVNEQDDKGDILDNQKLNKKTKFNEENHDILLFQVNSVNQQQPRDQENIKNSIQQIENVPKVSQEKDDIVEKQIQKKIAKQINQLSHFDQTRRQELNKILIQIIQDKEDEPTQKISKPNSQIIVELEEEVTQIKPPVTQQYISQNTSMTSKIGNISKSQPIFRLKEETDQMWCIKDLYDRIQRFKILCRVNYKSYYITQSGKKNIRLMLIDKIGDQILCNLSDKATERQFNGDLTIQKGRVYWFENGDVKQDENGELKLWISWSGITETKKIFWGFSPMKMLKVGQIQNQFTHYSDYYLEKAVRFISQNSQKMSLQNINVCGIYKGMKEPAKTKGNNFKIIGTICDPEGEKQINFMLFVQQLASLPSQGSVISLHNVRVTEYEQTIFLNTNSRSYLINQKENTHEFFSELIGISNKGSWKLFEYKNLSQISYLSRNIQQILLLLPRMQEQDQCYSQIDCSISKITQKKCYNACTDCRKEVKSESNNRSYCCYCKKVVKCSKRFIFNAEVADSTSSLELTFSSDQLQGFIGVPATQYVWQQSEDRNCLLQLSIYKNIVLKLKSIKVIGGTNHIGISANKPCHKRGLEHIKLQAIDDKVKYISAW